MPQTIRITVNDRALKRTVHIDNGARTSALLERHTRRRIDDEQDRMIEDFESRAVTREIDNETSENISNTLGGIGNLFSYIGFYAGTKPTEPIRNILNRQINFIVGRRGTLGGFYKAIIYIPSKQEIFDATPMPWNEGRSWAEGIELGIAGYNIYGLGTYRSPEPSRSGQALQQTWRKNPIRPGRFVNSKYISEILRNFIKRLKG